MESMGTELLQRHKYTGRRFLGESDLRMGTTLTRKLTICCPSLRPRLSLEGYNRLYFGSGADIVADKYFFLTLQATKLITWHSREL